MLQKYEVFLSRNPSFPHFFTHRLSYGQKQGTKGQRDKKTKRQKDKKTKRLRDEGTRRQRDKGTKGQKEINRSLVARWILHLLRLTTAQSLRLCTWCIHSAVPAGKRVCLSPCDGCNPTGGWCGRLKIRSLLGNFQPAQHQRLVRAVCIKRKGFFRFLSFIHSFNFWTIRVPKTRIFLH